MEMILAMILSFEFVGGLMKYYRTGKSYDFAIGFAKIFLLIMIIGG